MTLHIICLTVLSMLTVMPAAANTYANTGAAHETTDSCAAAAADDLTATADRADAIAACDAACTTASTTAAAYDITASTATGTPESSDLSNLVTLTEPQQPHVRGTYRNWLGEQCLDLGEGSKLYYNWQRDFTYAGIPLFLSSFIIKDKKKAFRSARHTLEGKFKSEIDNYTQFAPYVALVGLKACGYQGRSSWDRMLVSTLFSNMAMAAAVNGTKYSVREMRPDNSTRNSFPSGHTATAFVAATILHKEYGLTRSPWFSVGGYAVATGTGIMRVLNNRHWISDVVAGAGIGILSTELGYFAADLIYGNKGLRNLELNGYTDPDHPSFFDIQMGVGLRPGRINFEFDNAGAINDYIDLGTSTSFGVEGAYFLNKYIGIGAMARITTTPAKGFNLSADDKAAINEINTMLSSYQDAQGRQLPGIYSMYIDNGNFIDASLDLGVYGNLPLGEQFSLGAKFLVGNRVSGGITYKARNGQPKIAGTYTLVDGNKSGNLYWFEDPEGEPFISSDALDNSIVEDYNFVLENATEEYELMRVKVNNSFNYVAGISLTWHYKDNFAWKVFFDFDSSKKKYTYISNYFSQDALSRIASSKFVEDYPEVYKGLSTTYTGVANKMMNFLTIGASFSVCF